MSRKRFNLRAPLIRLGPVASSGAAVSPLGNPCGACAADDPQHRDNYYHGKHRRLERQRRLVHRSERVERHPHYLSVRKREHDKQKRDQDKNDNS